APPANRPYQNSKLSLRQSLSRRCPDRQHAAPAAGSGFAAHRQRAKRPPLPKSRQLMLQPPAPSTLPLSYDFAPDGNPETPASETRQRLPDASPHLGRLRT